MKRLLLSLAAAAAVAGPIAAFATDAAAQSGRGYYGRGYDRYDRGGRYDGRWDGGRWDRNRYNGYYYGGRWAYGPPPAAYYGRPGFQPGYAAWRPGGYLPNYYRDYAIADYGRYGLRPPPRGYSWYQAGNDYLLAAAATGLIFDIISR
jgi:Ni/Co efflux regulator RcnB